MYSNIWIINGQTHYSVPPISFPMVGHFPYFAPYEKVGLHKLFMKWSKECKSSIIGVDYASFRWETPSSHWFFFKINGTTLAMIDKFVMWLIIHRAVVLNDSKTIKEAFNLTALSGRPQSRALSIRGGNDGINRGKFMERCILQNYYPQTHKIQLRSTSYRSTKYPSNTKNYHPNQISEIKRFSFEIWSTVNSTGGLSAIHNMSAEMEFWTIGVEIN